MCWYCQKSALSDTQHWYLPIYRYFWWHRCLLYNISKQHPHFVEVLEFHHLYVANMLSSVSSGSAPHTWTRPSMAVRRRVSVGWKDSDWTTAFPTGSFNDKDPCKSDKQHHTLVHVLFLIKFKLVSSLLWFGEFPPSDGADGNKTCGHWLDWWKLLVKICHQLCASDPIKILIIKEIDDQCWNATFTQVELLLSFSAI